MNVDNRKEKISISILGSCMSRNLFGTSLLEDVFDIKCYAFQNCMFDLFGESLDIDKEIIYKIPTADFTARMLWYQFDKVTMRELTSNNPDYLMLDLRNIVCPICKVTYNSKSIYLQKSGGGAESSEQIIELSKSIIPKLKYSIVKENENLIKNGLQDLANWINENSIKVIIYIPKLSYKYLEGLTVKDYNEGMVKMLKDSNNKIEFYSNYLISLLNKKPYILDSIENIVTQKTILDVGSVNSLVPPDHYSTPCLIEQSKKLLELLNIDYRDFYIKNIEPKNWELIKLKNELLMMQKTINTIKSVVPNLNTYFDKIENLHDFIIIFSVKGDSSQKIKYFRNKNILGINMNIGPQESYVAIVDKSRNFIFEKSSKELIKYSYCVESQTIEIISANYVNGCKSSIKINEEDFCENKLGLNVVLLDSKDLVKIDSFNVDTINDNNLFISSTYLKNLKIRANKGDDNANIKN